MRARILFIDDQNIHFPSLKNYVEDICAELHLAYEIERVDVTAANGERLSKSDAMLRALREKINAVLTAARDDDELRVVLIFDNLMEVAGGEFTLEGYISQLWNEPPDEQGHQVPIIVLANNIATKGLKRLKSTSRPRSAVVSAIPPIGNVGLKLLEDAIRAAFR